MPLLIFISLFTTLFRGTLLVAQNYEYGEDKPISDYFTEIDEKSFFHQQRIHGMKREINNYSERLHRLQSRFDQIFYGLAGQNDFKTPFDLSVEPIKPQIRSKISEKPTSQYADANKKLEYSDPASTHSITTPLPDQSQVEITKPVEISKPPTAYSTNQTSDTSPLGKYFIVSPGFSIPYKTHSQNSDSYKYSNRRYRPGLVLNIMGGWKSDRLRFGIGGMYKINNHHDSSFEKVGGTVIPFSNQSQTFAGYLDLAYEFPLSGSIDGFVETGIGYYLSLIEAPRDRKNHGIFAMIKTGLIWTFSDLIALRNAYGYAHEEEVPAFLAEFGLFFDF